eukprot:5578579-Pleurochrysis_carterae.AAC.1
MLAAVELPSKKGHAGLSPWPAQFCPACRAKVAGTFRSVNQEKMARGLAEGDWSKFGRLVTGYGPGLRITGHGLCITG